jgi:hypothetical protein
VAAGLAGLACLGAGILAHLSLRRTDPILGGVACVVFLLGFDPLRLATHFVGSNLATLWVAIAFAALAAERDRIAAVAFAVGGFTLLNVAPAAVGATLVLVLADPPRGLRLMITGGLSFIVFNAVAGVLFGADFFEQVYLFHLGKTMDAGENLAVFQSVFVSNPWITGGAGIGLVALVLGVESGTAKPSRQEGKPDVKTGLAALQDALAARLMLSLYIGAALASLIFLASTARIFVYYFEVVLLCLAPLAAFGLVSCGRSWIAAYQNRSGEAMFSAGILSFVLLALQLPILGFGQQDDGERIRHEWRESGVSGVDAVIRGLLWHDVEVSKQRRLAWTHYLWEEADDFASAEKLAREAATRCGPEATLFGDSTSAPLVALLSDRRLSFDLADTNQMRFKGSDSASAALLERLEASPPCGVISREGHGLFNLTDFRIWLERRYEPVFESQDADGLRSYTLHIRR